MKSTLPLALVLSLAGCLSADHPLSPFESLRPNNIDDGWEVSDPSAEGIDSAALAQIYEDVHNDKSLWQLRSLLVFRNGRIVAESYLKDAEDQIYPRAVWSCTKQVLAVLVGIALKQGYIESLDDPISRYLSAELVGNEDKANITIENLLTMRSGIAFDETSDASKLLQRLPENTLQFILGLPLSEQPGQVFQYNSGNSHLIAASIQNAVGRPTDEWADDVLFSQIGFANYGWIRYDNYTFGGWGITTTPRELAKVAHVVMNRGAWRGTQVVDSLWIDAMLAPRYQDVAGQGANSEGAIDFGYHWWINSNMGAYFMAGSGGQYAVMVPSKEMVVLGFSEHDTDNDLELGAERFLGLVQQIAGLAN